MTQLRQTGMLSIILVYYIFGCGCVVIVRVSGLVGKCVEPIQHDN